MAGNPIAMYGAPTVVTDGATQTWDCTTASYFQWTLGASRTHSGFSNPAAGQIVYLEAIQDATGSRIITWPANVSWAAGTAPTLTTTASAYDVLRFTWNPTRAKWIGETVGKAFA